MKKKTIALVVTMLLSLAFLPQFISYAANLFQQLDTGWVVWETSTPVQRVAWDGSALWAGQYKGGLSQWSLETGQSASYTTANGLTGNHVVSIAVDGGGQKWLALQDGSLNLTSDGASFNDLTPAGIAGENAWDVSLSGSEAWLATLGGGVSRYSGGSWITYNMVNSNLPYDDIYAVAANSGSPWVGTIGYGVANLQGDTWVSYTLPVQIPDPLQAGAFKSNQAVTDIVVDGAGNKWFATDGSGVVVLDASNSNWTVYDTSNSGISSNFIQRIYIDLQGNTWFGTLGGGVSRLSANLTDWQTYNTTNSPLPEDDVLDVTMDGAGGLWLASYDSGLAYYGALPSPSPEFQLDLKGQPEYTPGQIKGYYLWVNPDTFEWTLAWSGDGRPHSFTGEISSDSTFTILQQNGMEEGDSASTNGNSLIISANEQNGEDSITFKPDLTATELTIHLQIDGAYYPYNIHIGSSASTPGTAPFRIPALQPQAPVVNAGDDITITEGEYLVLSADVADPDSPLGHTYTWDFGDTTASVNTLLADHIYKDEGTYTAQLTVTDVHGLTSTDSVSITVQNIAPTADFYFDPFEPKAGESVTFTGSFYDPGELDTHTITWDFGDGSAPVTGQSLETAHAYLSAGTFQVAFTAADNDGGTNTISSEIVVAAPPTYTLTVNVVGNGSVTRSSEGPYLANSTATLTPAADPGWTFTGWSSECTGVEPCSVSMSSDKTITATFTQDEYTLNVVSEHGTVSKSPDQATYHYGDIVQLQATAAEDWEFTNWTVDATGTDNPVSISINGNTNVTANYTGTAPLYVHTLVLQPNGVNGVDAYLLSTSANSNYGTSSSMGVGENNNSTNKYARSLIKFDLNTLPTDAVIVSASLSLWTSADVASNDAIYSVYRLRKAFNETQATWNNAATGTPWQSPGAAGADDRETTAIGSVQILNNEALGTEKQVVLDPAKVQEMINGSFVNNGFILTANTELNNRFDFKTSDNSTVDQRPKLVIQYTSPSMQPPAEGMIFANGFESGNFYLWSNSITDGGDLFASTQAAAAGTYGMEALADDTNVISINDQSPNSESHYTARFYLNPNSISMTENDSVYILTGDTDPNGWAFCMRIEKSGEYYKLSICVMDDGDIMTGGRDIYITDDWQAVEIEWKAATAVGANDGYMNLWINDVLMDTISGIDSDASRITDVTLGLLTSHPANINGSIYFDAFESRQGQHIGLDPNGPTLTPALTNLVFVDGFESNDLSTWSYASSGGGHLSASTQAAGIGQYGLQAMIDNTNNMALYDSSPVNAKHINTRFYFDPNSVQITSKDGFYLFEETTGSGWVACVYFEQQGQYYSLSLCGVDDSGAWHETSPVLIADAWQAIEVEWMAATAPGANDGFIKLYVGDQLVSSLENLDNDTQSITESSLQVDDSFTGTGTIYFDGYKTVIGSHIGLDPNGPSVSAPLARPDTMFEDDFENGNLSKWQPTLTVIDGGDLSVSANAAYQSGFGLQALIDDTTVIKAVDLSPAAESHYRARFYFDPNSIVMNSGNTHYILDGYNESSDAQIFRLELIYENGQYKLRPNVMNDTWSNMKGSKYPISDDWHMIELEWKRASAPGANDGLFSLWIDETLAGTLAYVDNDASYNTLDEVRLGATSGVDSTTSGSTYFDGFVSHRETYIGSGTIIPTATPTSLPSSGTISVPIISGDDDVEEENSGWMYFDSTDLELVTDSNAQQVGLRFTGVNLPQGATILNAYVQFTVDETSSEATSLTVQAEATDNSVNFSSSGKVSVRPRTFVSVIWEPVAWSTQDGSGPNQRTPDLSAVIQEVVNRQGWTSGNAISVLITGIGKRVAVAYEGNPSQAPYLVVEYTTEPLATPTVTPSETSTPTETPTLTPIPESEGTPTTTPTSSANLPENGYSNISLNLSAFLPKRQKFFLLELGGGLAI